MDKLEKYDERTCALAATVFTDLHYGQAISKRESDYRAKLMEAYKQEIEEAKAIVATHPNFNSLSYENKIIFCIELLRELRVKNNKEIEVDVYIAPQENVSYGNIIR